MPEYRIDKMSYEELMATFDDAIWRGDHQVVEWVKQEALSRDGWDDTDPRWGHLLEECAAYETNSVEYYRRKYGTD